LKIRRLPDLDVARIGPLPRDQKRRELEQMKLSYAPHTYDPTRKFSPDILNIQSGPLGVVERASWETVEREVRRASRHVDEATANVAVSKALYSFATAHGIAGVRHEIFPLKIATTETVTFWLRALMAIDGMPTAALIDPRRAKKLTKLGRQFAFSAMHERIRAADPDYSDIELGIFQFDALADGSRYARLYRASEVELWDFDTLDQMVRETYEIWHEVLAERDADSRRRGTGTTGPLGI
jgi:hypothetical protein